MGTMPVTSKIGAYSQEYVQVHVIAHRRNIMQLNKDPSEWHFNNKCAKLPQQKSENATYHLPLMSSTPNELLLQVLFYSFDFFCSITITKYLKKSVQNNAKMQKFLHNYTTTCISKILLFTVVHFSFL